MPKFRPGNPENICILLFSYNGAAALIALFSGALGRMRSAYLSAR
jgi:hypothetical protein